MTGPSVALLLVLAAAGRAVEISRIAGPVHLKGVVPPMEGPTALTAVTFERSGWITKFSVRVLDSARRPVDRPELLCHSVLLPKGIRDEDEMHERRLLATMGLEDGKTEFAFPEGYGYFVASTTAYGISTILQSGNPAEDADYSVQTVFAVTPLGEGRPLKPLENFSVGIPIGGDFHAPPGLHTYREEFAAPFSGRIHGIMTHAHRYATRLSLEDAESGRTLYADRVLYDAKGRIARIPSYTSSEGLPVTRGHRYAATITYDNPLKVPVSAMGTIRYFLSRDDTVRISRVIGPVALKGRQAPMSGPSINARQRFAQGGWLTAFSSHVIDVKKSRRDHDGIFCHSVVRRPDPLDAENRFASLGLYAESLRLALSEGQNELRFPEGFGVRVDSNSSYDLESVLQSDGAANDGDYSFALDYDIAPADHQPPLKDLTGLRIWIKGDRARHSCGDVPMWSVPPGRHSYEMSFQMPYAAHVHYIATHIHSHVREISLLDAATGRALYQTPVINTSKGYPEKIPVYSSAEGLPLEKGGRYVFRLSYLNPLDRPVETMGTMRLYVHPDP